MSSRFRPVLLIGASGMLGRAWRERLEAWADGTKTSFEAPPRAELDLLRPETLKRITRRHGWVVNCAAWTDVDAAESDPAGANALNGYAVGDLAARCAKVGAVLVHYSTDYVFEGVDAPLPITAARRPAGAYGRSKEVGEELLERSCAHYLLVRTSWLYAPWGKNFVRTIAKASNERPTLKVVKDQRGRPTSAEHLVQCALRLMLHFQYELDIRQTLHVTDGGECTWYDFAREIVRHVNPACRVEPCTTAEFPRPAKRPAYSVLDTSETEKLLGPMPHWKDNLADVLRRLEL